jgi:excinuclease UvrABC ATPase subunit
MPGNNAKCPRCGGDGSEVVMYGYGSAEQEACDLCSGVGWVSKELAAAYRLFASSGVLHSKICDELFKAAPSFFA